MFAALPMYVRAETRAAHDALWALIRDGLRARGQPAPDALDHEAAHNEGWGRADLVLSQICNLPYRALHRSDTQIVGTADYEIEGVASGFYRSLYVVRRDDPAQEIADLAGRPMALSESLSHSGWGAAWGDAQERGIALRPKVATGAHRASIAAVAEGAADFAAIDAHTWWVEGQVGNPDLHALRVIGATPPSPGMTFITAPGRDAAATFEAIDEAIDALPQAVRATLRLRGIVRLPASAYDIPLPDAPVFG